MAIVALVFGDDFFTSPLPELSARWLSCKAIVTKGRVVRRTRIITSAGPELRVIGPGGASLGFLSWQSVQAMWYLPEATNDSIFAVMGETFGFVGFMAILALFGRCYYQFACSREASKRSVAANCGGFLPITSRDTEYRRTPVISAT